MKLTKEVVQQVKKSGEDALLEFVSHFKYDNSKVFFILNSLGYLPRSFKGYWLFDYSTHENPKIRLAAIKNIGKLKLNGEINQLKDLLYAETKTEIRREIISSIGRQKNKNAQPILFKILQDNDPKIVCQAIRALLIFKNDEKVIKRLKELRNHKNEMVQAVIEREFFSHLKVNSNLHHTETFNFLKNTIVHGDVREILKSVPDESVHLTFTSPPYYNARDYSIYPSYKDYLKFLEEVFQATYRITKEGRFLLINTSPIILPRVSRKHSSKRYPIPYDLHHYIVKIGWEYIDDIIWLKPDASVKNRVGGFQQHRKPLGYKPNTVTEMIMVYRKKTTKLLDWNMRQYSKEIIEKSRVHDSYESTNVWRIDPVYSKNHSAVFPTELCKKVIQYYSFEGDLVFDPFAGSGTFGRTANALNRLFFLAELNRDYFNYMKSTKKSKLLFDELETTFLELNEFQILANDVK